jgi:hypothetical protein
MTEAGILDALGQPPRPVVMPVIVMLIASDGEEIATHPHAGLSARAHAALT